MSKIHKKALASIAEGTEFNSDELIVLFKEMEAECEQSGSDVTQLMISFLANGDELEAGTYVPSMWLILQKVVEDDKVGQ